ncbi:hypothetical protein QJ48_05330 [Paenibacillus sp. A3]|nr:hypothetical protein QJ48_05330 [Paenibacillus sp. A3]
MSFIIKFNMKKNGLQLKASGLLDYFSWLICSFLNMKTSVETFFVKSMYKRTMRVYNRLCKQI